MCDARSDARKATRSAHCSGVPTGGFVGISSRQRPASPLLTAVLADLDAARTTVDLASFDFDIPAITAALANLGRNGVPVYVFYAPGKAPVVLSEVLGVDEVRAAIAAL